MFKITKGTVELSFTSFTFPGGEVSVRLDPFNPGFYDPKGTITLTARLRNSEDIMKLALLKDALSHKDGNPVRLFMPYVPYGRQDRVCNEGESFSLKVFAEMLNAMRFSEVVIFDPHSDVTPALIDRVKVISQKDIIHHWPDLINRIQFGTIIVSPDAGANKKIGDIAAYLGHTNFIRADKLRDLSTGKIKETIVYADDLKDKMIVILDDICDGGKTFTELATVLKAKGAAKVVLYVTHGIFSKGLDTLYSGGIDEIWTTNSIFDRLVADTNTNFHILNLDETF